MLIKTQTPNMEIRAARLYVSPRTRPLTSAEMETRALSYLLKEPTCPQEGIDIAVQEMAALIQGPCCLIPVPSRTGDTSANLRLCQAIAAKVEGGATVTDVLGRSQPVESSCNRHKAGKPPLAIAEHCICRKVKKMIPANSIWFVDNTTTSGSVRGGDHADRRQTPRRSGLQRAAVGCADRAAPCDATAPKII